MFQVTVALVVVTAVGGNFIYINSERYKILHLYLYELLPNLVEYTQKDSHRIIRPFNHYIAYGGGGQQIFKVLELDP